MFVLRPSRWSMNSYGSQLATNVLPPSYWEKRCWMPSSASLKAFLLLVPAWCKQFIENSIWLQSLQTDGLQANQYSDTFSQDIVRPFSVYSFLIRFPGATSADPSSQWATANPSHDLISIAFRGDSTNHLTVEGLNSLLSCHCAPELFFMPKHKDIKHTEIISVHHFIMKFPNFTRLYAETINRTVTPSYPSPQEQTQNCFFPPFAQSKTPICHLVYLQSPNLGRNQGPWLLITCLKCNMNSSKQLLSNQ